MDQLGEFASARERMVRRQIADRGVEDERVLAAMRAVPREAFVPEGLAEFAYDDAPLPIEADQTISQPYIVALMLELAAIGPDDRVLEVGAGSGYAAAVMGRLAREVFAVERHASLAHAAARRLDDLDIANVHVTHADGTRGSPDAAPFDAILVAAGAAVMPEALKAQLARGGRLVIPVGGPHGQILKRIEKLENGRYSETDHGLVSFVPLVTGGMRGDAPAVERDPAAVDAEPAGGVPAGFLLKTGGRTPGERDAAAVIRARAEPFDDMDALARLSERFADRRVVMLGEATHGTHEFYEARARITERLVAAHGFNIVAIEADWPDAAVYDAAVRGRRSPEGPVPFTRFPPWMWRNGETARFLDRLRALNEDLPEARKAGFYGLDIYSLGHAIDAVLAYLEKVDRDAAERARVRYGCLTPFRADPASYGRMALSPTFADCEEEVVAMLQDLLAERLDYEGRDGRAFFDAEQNARVVAQAEAFYRAMYYGGPPSWNLRDSHMADTLERLLAHRGPDAKAVVWAHNSHVGDARHTDMGKRRGEHNLGQLARERHGDEVALVGFGTDRGTVAAASEWGGPMDVKRVLRARPDSHEGRCRAAQRPEFLLDLREPEPVLAEPRLERAIGVVYRPESELVSHYFEADLTRQFDAWIWFDETRALDARLTGGGERPALTYPWSV
jgi:protein-L-isoaspartate(D-aspartate) O-methyltransferase